MIASPKLKLEANPIARRFGRAFLFATVLFALVAYLDVAFGIVIAVASLLVSASNLGRAWVVRAHGEERYLAWMVEATRRSQLWQAVACQIGAAGFMFLTGLALIMVSRANGEQAGYWFGLALCIYAFVAAFHGTTMTVRLFRMGEDEE
jgi:hypothetical protein